ncbi:hypothetical protein [Flavobacterium sp.]|uniref:hypothetical protein n=1 Tax=Flavobacterium sp. TaxID=239 RepID=UPI00260AEC87|nr:hypothetical protein [Flavobacterium sp.]
MEILQTNDYSKFQKIVGNRNINNAKIDKIINDINQGFNMLPYCPIIVSLDKKTEKFNIIDGQHRREISERTGNPVYYVVCDTLSLKQIAQLNSRGEKWKPSDFLSCYINLGIEDYKDIVLIMNEFGINIKVTIDLLMYFSHSESKSTDIFQSGDFKTNYLKETRELLALVNDLFSRYTFSKDKYLIGAVQKIKERGKCDFEVLKAKISLAPVMMDKQVDLKNYIYNIERVYNFKNQNRQVIY